MLHDFLNVNFSDYNNKKRKLDVKSLRSQVVYSKQPKLGLTQELKSFCRGLSLLIYNLRQLLHYTILAHLFIDY